MNSSYILKHAIEAFDNFIAVDKKGVIVYINENYCRFLGVERDEAIGKDVREVIKGTRMHIIVREGKPEMGSIMRLYNNIKGEYVTLVCNRIPIISEGEIVGAIASTTLNDSSEIDILVNEIEEMKEINQNLKKELDVYKSNTNALNKIVGKSELMMDLKKEINTYAKSNLPILITGETGVGKEVFSNAIHSLSNRFLNNYVKINCSAIPENLLESELFGYEEGAFSGSKRGGKIGKFELANEGTILLDEIGELPLSLQPKILRVLQEKELTRVGGLTPIKIDVRIICNTNVDLEKLVEEKLFREDLYYRINTVEIEIPPLRKRISDVEPLSKHIIEKINELEDLNISEISEEALSLLKEYSWPGNVRELENVLHRASILSKTGKIDSDSLNFFTESLKNDNNKKSFSRSKNINLSEMIEEVEKQAIIDALIETGGNKTNAADLLQINRNLLYDRINKYDIEI